MIINIEKVLVNSNDELVIEKPKPLKSIYLIHFD